MPVPSIIMEEAGFMTYTAVSHQGVQDMVRYMDLNAVWDTEIEHNNIIIISYLCNIKGFFSFKTFSIRHCRLENICFLNDLVEQNL